jgi:hypothetical protein
MRRLRVDMGNGRFPSLSGIASSADSDGLGVLLSDASVRPRTGRGELCLRRYCSLVFRRCVDFESRVGGCGELFGSGPLAVDLRGALRPTLFEGKRLCFSPGSAEYPGAKFGHKTRRES